MYVYIYIYIYTHIHIFVPEVSEKLNRKNPGAVSKKYGCFGSTVTAPRRDVCALLRGLKGRVCWYPEAWIPSRAIFALLGNAAMGQGVTNVKGLLLYVLGWSYMTNISRARYYMYIYIYIYSICTHICIQLHKVAYVYIYIYIFL